MSNETSARIEGESGLSDEQVVKQAYPDASVWRHGSWRDGFAIWKIYDTKHVHDNSQVLGIGESEEEAWANARARIEAKPEPLPNTLQEEPAADAWKRGWLAGYSDAVHDFNTDQNSDVRPYAAPKVVDSKEERNQEDIDNARMAMQGTPREKAWEALFETHVALQSTLRERDAEAGRWQAAIYELLVEATDDSIDGGGCDSGDPLDFTLAEISQALEILKSAAPKVEEQDGEQEPVRPKFVTFDSPHADDCQLRVPKDACGPMYHSWEADALFEKLEAENKLLKTESADSPKEPTVGCAYQARTGATLVPRLIDSRKGTVMYTNSVTGDLHEVSMETWSGLLAKGFPSVAESVAPPSLPAGYDLSARQKKMGLIEINLRRRIHNIEGHNQYFFRCESAWCNPTDAQWMDPATEIIGDRFASASRAAAPEVATETDQKQAAVDAENEKFRSDIGKYEFIGKPLDSECFYGYHAPRCNGCNCTCHTVVAAPVALPTHQIVESTCAAAGDHATWRCSCGRTFVGVGDGAPARSRASFEAHLPEKEGK